MTTNPMDSLRKRPPSPARQPFPDPLYAEYTLAPAAGRAWELLGTSVIDALAAHVVVLAEGRVIKRATAVAALATLQDAVISDMSGALEHWLAPLEAALSAADAADGLLGVGREELGATARRMVLRAVILDYAERVVVLREALAKLAQGHLTTLLVMTAAQQAVQPTTLAHYVLAQLGPLERTSERVRELYARVNRSPAGAASGMGTAIPLRRDRAAELLGFERVVENTIDALAASDIEREVLSVIALQAGEAQRLVSDLAYWARDDVGIITPGDEFVHRDTSLPQRRDPAVLSYLALTFAELSTVPAASSTTMLGDERIAHAFALRAIDSCNVASASLELASRLVDSLVVERAASANRAQRGFPTASELTDFFVMDHALSVDQAARLAQAVVTEALTLNIGAMHLTTDLIDRIALREIGVELGIEIETLSRILAPRPFIERRSDIGGPAPSAVRESLDRAALAVRRDSTWVRDARAQVGAARERLQERWTELTEGDA
jgi:argininosuccinate lyase